MPRRRYLYVSPLLALSLLLILMSLPGFSGRFLNSLNASASAAATFTVNSTGDGPDINPADGVCDDGSGVCTLRAAIQEANAASGADTINFSLAANSTITLNTQLPAFIGNISIVGPGASLLTIQRSSAAGTPIFQVFSFIPINGNFNDSVSGLTILNGNATGTFTSNMSGGGIFNFSACTLTLIDVVISGSTSTNGGGLYNEGTATLTNCKVTGNSSPKGGGILNRGTLNLTNTIVSGNTAVNGGGIMNDTNGVLTVTDSSVSGNTANGGGGGGIINNSGTVALTNSAINGNTCSFEGGGLTNLGGFTLPAGIVTLTNSTVSGNTATQNGGTGGIYNGLSNNTLTLSNSTITGNIAGGTGGSGVAGIFNAAGSTFNLTNSIVANNMPAAGSGISHDLNGTFNSQGYNLIGISNGTNGFTNGVNGDQVGTPAVPLDPLLGPLANNGGSTSTHALLVGSPAIDAGNSALLNDQRGQPRPVNDQTVVNAAGGNGSDIGAYEAHNLEINSTADTDDGLCRALGTGNGCTLREAINAANAELGAELITFAPALTSGGPATISLLTALADLSSDLTISGSGAALLIVERSNAGGTPDFSVFHVTGGTITIAGLTVSNGNLVGILNNQGTLTVSKCIIDGNNEIGIMNGQDTNATLILNDSTISNHIVAGVWNRANLGAIVTAMINNSTISGNGESGILNAAENGAFATLTVNDSTLSGNNSGNGSAGGLLNRASTAGTASATINNSTISGNHASEVFAGGISVTSSESGSTSRVTLNGSTVSGNVAPPTGSGSGGINIIGVNSLINLRNTIVAGNIHNTATTFSDISGPVDPASSFNLIGDGSGMTGISNGSNGNQIGTSLAPIDPRLGPLSNNGGPTQTHALLTGSPALDAGNNALIASPPFIGPPFTDQRGSGFGRIVDGPDADTTDTVDIGAFEAQVSVADLADQTINEDGSLSLPFNVGGVASITSVTATSSNTALVPNNPDNISISGSGSSRTLQINPAANASATSTITVTVNGNNSQTMTDTFLLTVNPVNDAPSFTKGPDQTVNENSGAQTINNWASNISAGPANEAGQSVSFMVTNNSNAALFAVGPAISSTGTLTYTPATGVSGTAVITIAVKDNGGTANGGIDTSATQSFNITVREGGALQFSSSTFARAEDGGNAVITVSRTGGSAGEARVDYATSIGTATAGQDYTSASGTLVFADGITTQSFNVPITNDAIDEPDETINLTLTNTAGSGSLGTPANAVLTITDNDPTPGISIDNTAVNEGNSGTATATFTVSLSGQSGQTVTVNYTTANVTATAGSDYLAASGTLTFLPLETTKPITVTVNGDINFESDETFVVNLSNPVNATIDVSQGGAQITNDDAQGGFIAFSQSVYTVGESGGFTTITVNRTNDLSGAATVDYFTRDYTDSATLAPCNTVSDFASSRCDYTSAFGTLRFEPGQTSKTFIVLISQDSFVETPESLSLTLTNLTGGAAFGSLSTATVTIADDATEPATNPIDSADAFVRQHYHDFLNREADAAGLAFWTNQITECQQPGATCNAEVRRINVSAAFFLSIEFQETGYLVYRFYKSAYGNITGTPVPLRFVSEFLPDTQQIGRDVVIGQPGADQQLENNKVAYALDFVSRSRFTGAYPTTLAPTEFVDALFANAGVTPSATDRDAAINEFGGVGNTADTAARARALRRVAENSTLKQQETNKAFVLMQYFGYLRRNPNDPPEAGLNFDGYNFWLGKLNEFNGNFVNAEMVKAFIVSGEYRHRFGPR